MQTPVKDRSFINLDQSFVRNVKKMGSQILQRLQDSKQKKEAKPDECQQHQIPLVGVCLESTCENRFICYECIYEKHSSHAKNLVFFKKLKQKDKIQIQNLFKDEKVYEIYRALEKKEQSGEQLENQIQKIKLQEIKDKYIEKFRNLCKNLQTKLENNVENMFSRFFTINNEFQSYLFNESYKIEELIEEFEYVIDKEDYLKQMFLLKLDRVFQSQKATNKKILGFSFNNQKQKFENGLNEMFEEISQQTNQQVENLLKQQDSLFKDLNYMSGFKPVIKISNTQQLDEDIQYWTQMNTTKDQNFIRTDFTSNIIKSDFYNRDCKQILIECHQDGKVRKALLEKQKNRPLFQEFLQKEDQKLKLLEGNGPIELIKGVTQNAISDEWIINGKLGDKCKTKLGYYHKENEDYEVVGIGLSYQENNQTVNKSAGIISFSDQNQSTKDFQNCSNINIYIK